VVKEMIIFYGVARLDKWQRCKYALVLIVSSTFWY
jgi:hypothetical protein